MQSLAAALYLLLSLPLAAVAGQADQPAQGVNFDDVSKKAAAALSANPGEAAALYRQGVTLRPDWAEGWFYLGASCYELGQFAESHQAFEKAAELAPERGTVWAFLGLTEIRLNDSRAALNDIRKGETLGLANDPKFIGTVRNQAALLCIRSADFSGAIEQLIPLAKQGDDSAATIGALGVTVLGIPHAPAEILAARQPLVELAGKAAWNLYSLHGDAANALSMELVRKYPAEPGVHYLRGICLVHSDPEQAAAEFRAEAHISPGYGPARLQLAMLAMSAGKTQSALELSRAAVRLQPDSALAHVILGRSLLDSKQLSKAIPELETGVKLAPGNPQTHFFLSQAYRQAGRPEDARKQKSEFDRLKATVDPTVFDYTQTTLSDPQPATHAVR